MAASAASMSPFNVTVPVPSWYPFAMVYDSVVSPTDPFADPLLAIIPVTFPVDVINTFPVKTSPAAAVAPLVS